MKPGRRGKLGAALQQHRSLGADDTHTTRVLPLDCLIKLMVVVLGGSTVLVIHDNGKARPGPGAGRQRPESVNPDRGPRRVRR